MVSLRLELMIVNSMTHMLGASGTTVIYTISAPGLSLLTLAAFEVYNIYLTSIEFHDPLKKSN
jgi:hypothetical protein